MRLCQGQAVHECEAMQAGMHHVRDRLCTSVRQHMQACIVRMQEVYCGVHFWFVLKLWTAFGQGQNKRKTDVISSFRVNSSWASLGDADCLYHSVPDSDKDTTQCAEQLQLFPWQSILLEEENVAGCPTHFNSEGCIC